MKKDQRVSDDDEVRNDAVKRDRTTLGAVAIVALILQATAVTPAAWADADPAAGPSADVQEISANDPAVSPSADDREISVTDPVTPPDTGGDQADTNDTADPEESATGAPIAGDAGTAEDEPAGATASQDAPAAGQQDAVDGGDEAGGIIAGAAAVPDEWPAGEYKGAITVGFALDKVTLGAGTVVSTAWRTSSPPAVDAAASEAFSTWGTYSFVSGSTGVATTVDYPIVMQGVPTGLHARISVKLTTNGSLGRESSCVITRSDGTAASPSPFNCSGVIAEAASQGGVWYSHATFSLSLNRWVQTSGEIVTTTNSQQRAVSLTNGTSTWNGVPYHTSLPTQIGADSRVSFDDVVREGDSLDVSDYAKRVFSYQIVDGQSPIKLWVVGWSQNYRGASFRGDSGCFVTDQDPTNRDAPTLQELHRADVTGYFCERSDTGPVDGDRGHYSVTFSIGRRVMETVDATTEDNRQRQKQILSAHCKVSVADCGLTFSTVTSAVIGGEKILKGTGAITNRSDQQISEPVVVNMSDTSTFGFGQEVDLSFEAGWPELGEKFTTTVKISFSQTVSTTRSISQTVPLPVPAQSIGWLTDAVSVIQTQGAIVVRDGNRYWELTGAVANLIDTDVPRVFDSKSRALTPQELGGVGAVDPFIPDLGALTPGAVPADSPPAMSSAATAGGRLAATGAAGDQASTVAAIGAGVMALGALLVLTRRRRHTGAE